MDVIFNDVWRSTQAVALILTSAILIIAIGSYMFESELKERIVNKRVILTLLWIGNLMIFMCILWGGEYYYQQGYKWIVTPIQVSLFSSGLTKAVLSVLLLFAWKGE